MSRTMASERLMASIDFIGGSLEDKRLSLAVDLFVSSGFEPNPFAMFLLRMTVLEVLAERSQIDEAALDVIEEWIASMKDFAAKGLTDDLARSLRGRLQNLRKRSISKSVEELVRAEVGTDGARRISELYELRSRMIHDGIIPDRATLHVELNDLTVVVRKVLQNRIGPR
jgi:hypothetical protein